MRAAVIFGLGTSSADLRPFRERSQTEWTEGLPVSPRDADAILIFGGDGTLHRHLAALVELKLPVLVVPAGSGNDFSRALNLRSQRDSLRAWREFEAGKIQPRAIDLGVIVEAIRNRETGESTAIAESSKAGKAPEGKRLHYFCGVAACGLDSTVARRANQMPRWLRGHGGYVLALLPLLAKLPAFRMRLSSQEHREESDRLTLLAAFANTQFYGGGMRIAPLADFSDGKLDICRILYLSAPRLFFMFPTIYFGGHLRVPEVEYSRTARVTLQSKDALEIYADGEFVCTTPVEIAVGPGLLRVITAK
jgi:diacylglycerol kinase (ATP)